MEEDILPESPPKNCVPEPHPQAVACTWGLELVTREGAETGWVGAGAGAGEGEGEGKGQAPENPAPGPTGALHPCPIWETHCHSPGHCGGE